MATKRPLVKKAVQPRRLQPDSEPKDLLDSEVEETEELDADVLDEDDDQVDDEIEEDNKSSQKTTEQQPAGSLSLSPSATNVMGNSEYEEPPAPLDRTANPMVNQNAEHEPIDFGSLPGAPQGNALVLGPDEPLRVDGEPSPDKTFIRLNKAVYRAKLPMGSKRWTFILEYPAHAQIPMSIVQPVDRDPEVPTVYPYSAQP